MSSEQIDNIQEKLSWHWRNSMQTIRFFAFDSRSALPIPILFVYFRPITLGAFVTTLFVFRMLERKGLTVPAALRNLRSWLVGQHRPGWLGVQRRTFKDYG